MPKKRKSFSNKTKEKELVNANLRCRKCKKKLDLKNTCFNFNHKKGRDDNSQRNCEVLCLCCHWIKTKKQIRNMPKYLLSQRALKAWKTRGKK